MSADPCELSELPIDQCACRLHAPPPVPNLIADFSRGDL